MPKSARLPPGWRVYARPDKFVIECPRCDCLIFSDSVPSRQRSEVEIRARGKPIGRRGQPYDPISGRVTCPSCGLVLGVGIVLWRVRERAQATRLRPTDQRAEAYDVARREAYKLGEPDPPRRERFGILVDGWYVSEDDALNLEIAATCICGPTDAEWDPQCPLHRPMPKAGT